MPTKCLDFFANLHRSPHPPKNGVKVLYGGNLKAGVKNRNVRLGDSYKNGCSMFLKNPFLWVDHSGFGMYEGDDNYPNQHESFHNSGEAMLVASIYHHYRTVIGVPDADIGIISCYWAQVAHIREALEAELQKLHIRESGPAYAKIFNI